MAEIVPGTASSHNGVAIMSLPVRFRLGSLLWMIALVAVLLGWWIDRHQLVSRYRKAQSQLRHEQLLQMRDYAIERDRWMEQNYPLAEALERARN
jgi:hypothetical protein